MSISIIGGRGLWELFDGRGCEREEWHFTTNITPWELFYSKLNRYWSIMGQNVAKFNSIVKSVREDEAELTTVTLESTSLQDKDVRRLCDALVTNRLEDKQINVH